MLRGKKWQAIVTGTLGILLLAMVISALHGPADTFAQMSPTASEDGVLRVNGSAVITGAPDIANITLGVETRDPSAEKAAAENADRMAEIIAVLKEFGLTDEEMTTSSYNVYSYQQTNRTGDGEQQVTVYSIQNRVKVTTRDLDSVGHIIDLAIKAGANQVQGIRFDIEDKQTMQLLALQDAIKQARLKAEAMAEGAGVELGGLKVISEQSANYVPYNESFSLRAANVSADTMINPGDVQVNADVVVEFWF